MNNLWNVDNKIFKSFDKNNFRIAELTYILFLIFILIRFQFLEANSFDFENKYLY